jgi:hypothetical protein
MLVAWLLVKGVEGPEGDARSRRRIESRAR